MGASSSAQPAAEPSGSDAAFVATTQHEVEASRVALDPLRSTIATRHATDITESIRRETDAAGAGLHAVSIFLETAPMMRSLSNFRRDYQASLEQTNEIARGLSERTLDLLSRSERALVAQQFRPLASRAKECDDTLRRNLKELSAAVTRNQESDFIRAGLCLVETAILTNLDRELKSLNVPGEMRKRLVGHFKRECLRPFIEPVENDPLSGRVNHDALSTTHTELSRDKGIDTGSEHIELLGDLAATPSVLDARIASAERLSHDVDSLLRSSLARPEMDPALNGIMRAISRGLTSGLQFEFDFTWAPDPRQESCDITLESPWGDRGRYRYTVRPRPGEEIHFRREVAALLRDIESLGALSNNEQTAHSIEHRLHSLGGLPHLEATPLSTVEDLLREDGERRIPPASDKDRRAEVVRTLRQRFTFAALRVGAEGAEYTRFNRVGVEINGNTIVVKLFRERPNGTMYDSAPFIALTTNDFIGARAAIRSVESALRKSQGDISSSAGRATLSRLLAAESSPLIGRRPVFEVATMANVTLTDFSDLEIRLTPAGRISNLVIRNSSIGFSNRLGGGPGGTIVSNIAADDRSSLRLEFDGASLERMSVHDATIQCRNCTADDVSIACLSDESAHTWRQRGNRFVVPRRNAIVRSFSDRLAGLLGSEPTYSMKSRQG